MIIKYPRVRDVFRDVGPASYSIDILYISFIRNCYGSVGLNAKAVNNASALFQKPTTRNLGLKPLELIPHD